MERSDVEKPASEDGNQLNRNRSFKSKQLVRSQAIRESTSPPRTVSPSPYPDNEEKTVKNNVVTNVSTINNDLNNLSKNVTTNNVSNNVAPNNGTQNITSKNVRNVVKNSVTVKNSSDRTLCDNDGCGDVCGDVRSCDGREEEQKRQQVEIQITGGTWEESTDQRQRTRRWLGHKHHSDSSRDLLSNQPRVACVCGACANCPHCRGRRRRHTCPIKQDSGISCSDECPDCTDGDNTGSDSLRKSESVEVEEQTFYCRCPERKEKPKNTSLSRTDSEEKTEPTGPELVNFLKETLNKNARDRLTLLKIEKELHALVSDTGRCIVRFPVMTSYGRMLVHRCAALFQLSHHLDQTNKTSVMVSKSGTSGGRIPCTSFKTWCTATFPPSPQRRTPDVTHAKSILKRDTHSLDEPGNGSLANSRSKSLEQRERDYERMKKRIFSTDNCSQDESQWPWLPGGPVKVLTPGRNKLLKVQSLESSGPPAPPGCRGRGAVSKSHSFGGYAGTEPPTAHPRLLSRQGDLASSSWRLSPSSSGYKTLSLRSTDSVTPSPTGGASPEPCPVVPCPAGTGNVVWCVSDMTCVPPGALLIHPQTGRPLANPDGSVYRFDPANPPTLLEPVYPPTGNKVDQNEKKRGKLEKQHSFMDHGECECQPADETRNKCCCECRQHDACSQEKQDRRSDDKSPPEQKPLKPTSPSKPHYEQTDTTTDKKTTYESPTNQKPNYEPTNQRPAYTNDVPYYSYANERVYEATNQRPPSYEAANQREQRVKTNQESQEIQYNQYQHAVRNDEQVATPPQPSTYPHQDSMGVPQAGVQAKVTPVPLTDPNIRPISLTNMVYPTAVPHGYPYMNHCRMDQPLQPVYQQITAPQVEQQKQTASPHQESTFRIDPSYPYAALDYTAQCGACVDPSGLRNYNVPYGQVEIPQAVTIPSAYPVGNVMLPQQHIQHYPYQEPVQWQGAPLVPASGKLLPYPPLYHSLYSLQCSLLYPQVVPQPYPVCQPVYPAVVEKPPSRRNSFGSQRANSTASCTPSVEEHNNANNNVEKTLSRRNSTEIAVKIAQMKEQMAALSARPRARREEWRRRPAPGLLGSPPAHTNTQYKGFPNQHTTHPVGSASNDETQLTSAARAIVNSIRNMQAKSTYQDTRRDYNTYNREYRRRDRSQERQERPARDDRPRHAPAQCHVPYALRQDRQDRPARNDRPRHAPAQCHVPYALRQMSPGTWCRRSPAPVHPVLNHPRRPHPDTRNGRR